MITTKTESDLLLPYPSADRLHYATGELLGADDFRVEQTYHRRQLARALLYLHGSGTIAGLKVLVKHQAAAPPATDEVELEVLPGLALDGAGRLVEVPRECCLRLRRWFEFLAGRKLKNKETGQYDVDDLRAAWRPRAAGSNDGSIVADVFLAFHACDRGYTPAFASGPFDALDASQPSRVRDGYELSLVLRDKGDDLDKLTGDGNDPWGKVKKDDFANYIFNAWDVFQLPEPDHVGPYRERPLGVDPTAVLLARLTLPATKPPDAKSAPVPDWKAGTWAPQDSNLDNFVRQFVLPPAALRRLAGIANP